MHSCLKILGKIVATLSWTGESENEFTQIPFQKYTAFRVAEKDVHGIWDPPRRAKGMKISYVRQGPAIKLYVGYYFMTANFFLVYM